MSYNSCTSIHTAQQLLLESFVLAASRVSSRRVGINALLRKEPKKLCQVVEGCPGSGHDGISVSMPRQPLALGLLGIDEKGKVWN